MQVKYFLSTCFDLAVIVLSERVKFSIFFECGCLVLILFSLNVVLKLCLFLRCKLSEFSHHSFFLKLLHLLQFSFFSLGIYIEQQQCLFYELLLNGLIQRGVCCKARSVVYFQKNGLSVFI